MAKLHRGARRRVSGPARTVRGAVLVASTALVVSPLAVVPTAFANTAGTGLVISEVYGGGGNSNATYNHDFVELFNPTASAIDVSGMSVQYRSSGGTGDPSGVIPLAGSVPAKGYYLVQGGSQSTSVGQPLPGTPGASGNVNMSGTKGTVFLVDQTTALTAPPTGSVTGNSSIIDLVGFGDTNTWEGTAAAAPSDNATSIQRDVDGTDTDVNSADFTTAAATPGEAPAETPPPPPVGDPMPIADIQGTTAASPYAGQQVTTDGVVTAAYPTGGFDGFYLQTPGTGGAVDLSTHTASDAIFVYSPSGVGDVAVGDHVQVIGTVSEFNGLTELNVPAAGITSLPDAAEAVKPATTTLPADAAERESLEGMLVSLQGKFTVADNYSLNQYGEITLASGTTPLFQPTDVADPHDAAAIQAVQDENAARSVTLDDGSSWNYITNATAKDTPLPYLTQERQIRVGAGATFSQPMVFDYRNSLWKLQPTGQLTGDGLSPVTFSHTRTSEPAATGGDLHIASFNVLNYFPTTGAEYVADGGTCSSYKDRAGNPVTVNTCNGDGPRGAWDQVNFLRQQAKIVHAINHLGADVVSLEEIENSAKFGEDRDAAVKTLVQALNDDTAPGTWAYVPTPSTAGSQADEDVIRTAFIYKPASVSPVGESMIDDAAAFDNARDPLAQAFKPAGGPTYKTFAVIVNHFKSKGSGAADDQDQGQGASNKARTAQAQELVQFAKKVQQNYNTRRVFLSGDFNSYTQEDPMQVLYQAGYADIGSTKAPGEATYLFGGLVGSLDHVLANKQALGMVTGAHVWNINSVEPVALEYSRHNYNATDFYNQSAYRASDHDPLVVGVDSDVRTLNLLNINDFHGRIDGDTTKFATTVEQLRQDGGEGNTLFMAAGDNVGASLFASASANDNPTIDVMNALGMNASSVGNHEFDKGFSDLTGHLIPRADWRYLAANVYKKGTTQPALPGNQYRIFTRDGLKIGVVGAVTEEAPSLVSPGGIEDLDFGDPVAAVNRVTNQLTDGDPANGEADVIVAEYHEGASEGTPDGATFEEEMAQGGAFAHVVNDTSPKVAVIFTGHTHKEYSWDAPVPGHPGTTRPILQTGDYGANVGQVQLTVDGSGDVLGYTARNVPRVATADLSLPRVAKVDEIVRAALAEAEVKGGVPVAKVDGDITTAYSGGSYTGPDNTYVGPSSSDPKAGRDDRSSESTLGDLVADALLSSMEPNGAEIGVTNPGGLRDELFYQGVDSTNADGVVTYAEANSVLPFVNNLWTVDVTGAQFKQILEEQWQPAGSSRPFLHLGLSDNVSVTLDKDAPTGEHVTSVLVDGQPLDMNRTYRIGTFSFLATGGDNFTTFEKGTNVKDTGMVDRDAWIDYLGQHSPLSPQFDRREVYASNLPASIAPGQAVSFQLHRLDLTSLGSPANSTVEVTMHSSGGDQTVATAIPVADGEATVAFTAPASIPQGATFVVTANPSGTTVTIPAQGATAEKAATTVHAKAPASVRKKHRWTLGVTVSSKDGTPGGKVAVYRGKKLVRTLTLSGGKASVRMPAYKKKGRYTVTVRYRGTSTYLPSSTKVRIRVR